MGLLDGKVAVITGAGNGIGREHALLFAREGARVVVNDVGADRSGAGVGAPFADRVVEEIAAHGGRAVANHDSVATREGADNLVWTALSRFGGIDILVNNAGVLRDRTLVNLAQADWDLVCAVHLTGTFLCMQAAARQMKTQGRGGTIVNTTSLSGLVGSFGQGNYAAAKAGVYGLTRTGALELAKLGVRVNAIAPVALTRMTEDLALMQGASAATVGPQYVAPVALFLASELSAGLTGQIVGCEGGRVFLWHMEQTQGVSFERPWTAQEVRTEWERISAW